jgi:aerobic-type carbon monoxide dehydrogenase small subunit (CoxS/CutS family)
VPDRVSIELTLNGVRRSVAVEPHRTLLDALRDDLALTGAKSCCLVGECGACTVIVDGRAVDACLVLAAEMDGADVRTVEGLGPAGGGLSTLQAAFLEHGAVQCGYCIPGQLMAAQAMLEHVPHPSDPEIEEGLAGNLCRCACYEQIFAAVRATAEAARGQRTPASRATSGIAAPSPTPAPSPAPPELETSLPPESM